MNLVPKKDRFYFTAHASVRSSAQLDDLARMPPLFQQSESAPLSNWFATGSCAAVRGPHQARYWLLFVDTPPQREASVDKTRIRVSWWVSNQWLLVSNVSDESIYSLLAQKIKNCTFIVGQHFNSQSRRAKWIWIRLPIFRRSNVRGVLRLIYFRRTLRWTCTVHVSLKYAKGGVMSGLRLITLLPIMGQS